METLEHVGVGNGVSVKGRQNPYITHDGDVTFLSIMGLMDGIPQPIDGLKLTLGEMVAMPDYFSDPNWNMKLRLESCKAYGSIEDLGKQLIQREVTDEEENALLGALHDLAKEGRKRSSVDTIFKIVGATYFPVKAINEIIQQLMFLLRVKHYDRKLDKNQTHFTPWSIRVYTIGHTMALDYAETAYQLKQRAKNPNFISDNPYFLGVINQLSDRGIINATALEDYAHRFHAMSIEIEMYTAHYLSDHFAAGHMSQVGDLRIELPEKYGILGGLAVNTMHNELNHISVLTKNLYDPDLDETNPPLKAYGDGDFERCENTFNRNACIASLQNSVNDIEAVLDGRLRPDPIDFGALSHLPDVDGDSRQPEPMFLLHDDNILVRGNLRKIRMLGPDDYDDLQNNPSAWGYNQVKNKLHLLYIMFKLRVLPFYKTSPVPLTKDEDARIEQQEHQRQPDRKPIPIPPCSLKTVSVPKEIAFFERDGSPYIKRKQEHCEEDMGMVSKKISFAG